MVSNRLISLSILFLCLFSFMVTTSSCSDSSGSSGKTGFVAIITMASPTYIASNYSFADRLGDIFKPLRACATPDLSIDPVEFAGDFPVPENTGVYILDVTGSELDYAETDGTGRVEFSDIPSGYLRLLIIGGSGKTWSVNTHASPDQNSFCRVVMKDNKFDQKSVYAKTVHNSVTDGTNVDDFSIATLGRPSNSLTGGVIVIHEDGETLFDNNGDGDFIDPGDIIVIEPDDDGISSADGDEDEDNDGILDVDEQGDDGDIDGDGLSNEFDNDDDGDGIPDISDDTPGGI